MLSENQKKSFFKNYMFLKNSELCKELNCTANEIHNFVKNVTTKQLLEQCDYFKTEVRKDFGLIEEPDFSDFEIDHFEESKFSEKVDPVEKRIEAINGKQCTVFQSRLNYE